MEKEVKRDSEYVYRVVTERIISRLNEKDIPWRKAWMSPGSDNAFINYDSRKPYKSVINKMLLGKPGEYLTFGEIQKHKGRIKKGSHARTVVFYSTFVPKDRKEAYEKLIAEGEERKAERLKVPVLKYYNVYHIEDVEGIESKIKTSESEAAGASTYVADTVIDNYVFDEGVKIDEKACDAVEYDIDTDTLTLPLKRQFYHEEEWYGAVYSGLVRSTARHGRLDRKNRDSVKEELTAEIGSSLLLYSSGLEIKEADDNTDAQCQKWIAAMQNDLRLIVNACSAAQKASEYVLKNVI